MTSPKPRPPLIPGETRAYPVLPLRDIVVFPHMIAPLFVGRKKSILALEEVMRSDTFILLATQKNASDDDPATEAIYEVGTLASVLQLLKLPDDTVKVLVEGAQRAKVLKYTDRSEYYEAEAVALGDTIGERVEAEALARSATTEFESYVKLNKKVPPEVVGVVLQIEPATGRRRDEFCAINTGAQWLIGSRISRNFVHRSCRGQPCIVLRSCARPCGSERASGSIIETIEW